MKTDTVLRIDGLAAFSRNLRKLDKDLPKALRLVFNEVSDTVISLASRKVPRRTGNAAASLKARSTRTEVRVAAGSRKAPYYPWLDFGGRVGKGKRTVRPFLPDGRYLYQTYYELRRTGEFEQMMSDALVSVARQTGIEVD